MVSEKEKLREAVEGKYVLGDEIGRGNFGLVFEAVQLSTGQRVAIKTLASSLSRSSERLAMRFERELELCTQLSHPNIVKLLDSGIGSLGNRYVVYELIAGQTLDSYLLSSGALDRVVAFRLMSQVLDALACAHNLGIIHRDLKPSNIMVSRTGLRPQAMILDFGLGSMAGFHAAQPGITVSNELLGTPSYCAPEQLRGEEASYSADLYAWGLVFIECTTGNAAVKGEAIAEVLLNQLSEDPIEIPYPLKALSIYPVLRKVLNKDPAKRLVTTEQLLDSLEWLEPVGPTESEPPKQAYYVAVTVFDESRKIDPSLAFGAIKDCSTSCGGELVSTLGNAFLTRFEVGGSRSDGGSDVLQFIDRLRASMSSSLSYSIGVDSGIPSSVSWISSSGASSIVASNALALSRHAGADDVLVSARAREQLGSRVVTGERQAHAGQAVFRVLSFERNPSTHTSSFVGREQQLGFLDMAYQQALVGRGSFVCLVGENGIGKTRLVLEVKNRQDTAEKTEWIYLNCGVSEVFDEVRIALGQKTRAHTSTDSTDLSIKALIDLSKNSGVVLVIEDLEEIDSEFARWCDLLAASIRPHPILVILTTEDKFVADSISNARQVLIPRLTEEEVAALATRFASRKPGHRELARIAEYADGNPLFVREIVRHRDNLFDKEKWTEGNMFPAYLRELSLIQYRRFESALQLLQVAATIGREFRQSILHRLIDKQGDLRAEDLQLSIDRGLLSVSAQSGFPTYRFPYLVAQVSLYESIAPDFRVSQHFRVLRAIEDLNLETSEPELVARHTESVGLVDEAIDFWHRAGILSREIGEHNSAVCSLRSALRLVRERGSRAGLEGRVDGIVSDLADSIGQVSGFGSLDVLRLLSEYQVSPHDEVAWESRLYLLHKVARLYQSQGRYNQSLSISGDLLDKTASTEDLAVKRAGLLTQGFTLSYLGQFNRARDCLKFVDQDSGDVPFKGGVDRDTYYSSAVWLSWIEFIQGSLNTAQSRIRSLEKSAGASARTDVRRLMRLSVASDMFRMIGEYDQSLRYSKLLVQDTLERSAPFWHSIGLMLSGAVAARAAKPERAIEQMLVGLRMFEETGSKQGVTQWYALVAEELVRSDRCDEALQFVDLAERHMESTGEAMFASPLWCLRAQISKRSGLRSEEVTAFLDLAVDRALNQSAGLFALRAAVIGNRIQGGKYAETVSKLCSELGTKQSSQLVKAASE